ncbi:MAG TPA: c-type cytochrome, partial [Opitutaceae bacterium]|nr:c-type cytochrome [Opitutaceae bacterium]
DQLVMPRSFAFVKGGLLLQEPPKLWFCEDVDGDLRCDRRTQVGTLGVAGNPQHTANGLRYGLDNWLHNADATVRHRWVDGKLQEEPIPRSGQFGVTFDESGRFLTCRESSALHANLIPGEYLLRNPHLAAVVALGGRGSSGIDTNIATEAQQVYPIRVTPGITLGAMELREDGRLRTYTIASGTCYYDGDQFGPEARGNVFVPEAGGNLVGRLKLEPGVRPKASRFYPAEQEFLASTDERFRPINARVGPDGALYLADLARGIIEHVIFMVPWISDQVRDRKLDVGQDLGRIYRVVRVDRPIDRRPPRLEQATTAELVAHLSHPTGWWRLTSQRLLVERRDPAAVPLLVTLARRGENPVGRLHGLWTLEGCGALDVSTVTAAMEDPDEWVRAAAIRLAERALEPAREAHLLARVTRAVEDPSAPVRLQATLTASALRSPQALSVVVRLVQGGDDPLFRVAALSGLRDRELELVRFLVQESSGRGPIGQGEPALLALATQCVLDSADPVRVAELLDVLAGAKGPDHWQQAAALDAVMGYGLSSKRRSQPMVLAREPSRLIGLARGADPAIRARAVRLVELFTWPGASVAVAANGTPLTPAEQQRVTSGREVFTMYCAPCHQLTGTGAPNLAPPLVGSEWVSGSTEPLIRIVLHGVYGPIQVAGKTWNLAMPGLGASGALDDDRIAAVLSYVRHAWGDGVGLVEPAQVTTVRQATAARTLPWTAEELAAVAGAVAKTAPEAPVLRPQASGVILLPAARATVYGQKLGYRPALDVLAPWIVVDDIVEWRVEVPTEGVFDVWVNLAADADSAGDGYVVETEGSRTRAEVASTGDYDHFREQPAGRLTLRAGVNRIVLRPEGPLKRELADVRGVRLDPVSRP